MLPNYVLSCMEGKEKTCIKKSSSSLLRGCWDTKPAQTPKKPKGQAKQLW